MDLTRVTTKITSFEGTQESYEEIFLVDTGAIDSMAPGDEPDGIGVSRQGKMSYEPAMRMAKKKGSL